MAGSARDVQGVSVREVRRRVKEEKEKE
jgi:hypothetical protein